jgi:hypothetical protein
MRALKILVVVMGVLIVVGTATLAVLLVRRAGGDSTATSPLPASASALLRQLDEPSGTGIAAIALSPDRLAIHLHGGGPDRVVLIDPRNGATVARVALTR